MKPKTACFVRDKSSKIVYREHEGMMLYNFEPWHPQPGEYCWFLTCNSGYELGHFVRLLENGNFQYRLNMTNSLFNCSSCEPFFGTLPSFLQ